MGPKGKWNRTVAMDGVEEEQRRESDAELHADDCVEWTEDSDWMHKIKLLLSLLNLTISFPPF